MKKSLLALAVLGTFAGVASAQSTVTLFGIVDLNARNVKNGNNDALNTMSQDGNASSRLGFRGVEDLGGGLSAGFWLEAGLNPDTGGAGGSNGLTAPTNGSSNLFNRRSTVSLLGGWGELRLGRDYTPSFWNTTVFDPFGTNGVGAFTNLVLNTLGTNAGTFVRANNSIGYFLPSNLGGLYGQVQVSANEAAPINGNKNQSARIGYAAGPFNIAVSYGSTDALQGAVEQKYKHGNVAGSWNFGFMNLMAQYDMTEAGPREAKTYLIGTVVPLGQGEFKFSYAKTEQEGVLGGTNFNNADADQIAVGYVYNLSKRTAMYGHLARIKNKNAVAAFAIGGGAGSAANDTSRGVEVGVRHSF
jgi:predicted porin